MRHKLGIMGSAAESGRPDVGTALTEAAANLGRAIASHEIILLTGATTGIVYLVGKTAHDAGAFHIGVSPASNQNEHEQLFKLPVDACDSIIYTGFGLKGRNVVLVRSCDIVIFIAGAMGSLNEFTIAHDEGKIIGCLKGSGGVADEADYLLSKFARKQKAEVFQNSDPEKLISQCLGVLKDISNPL
ncbi:MAG TPA: hypothetical protein VLB68_15365 [Pyrinomonadaceae bacterium]|nr:hypothetical protein [Pyrinomonadaceae bacterium]